MRGRAVIASATLVAFTTLILWPRGLRADEQPPPPAPPAAAPANGDAAMEQAKQHFETGRNAYNAGDYVSAIREFKAAEQLRPSPILDYNIGLANEKLGKRRVALKYYKRYLEIQPNASNKAEVEGKISTLEADIAAQPPPAANTQPGGTAPQPNVEQPGDMPPPDTSAQPGAAASQPGYDPYSSTAPPGAPPAKAAKKKSLWWIWLIVGGAATITLLAVVIWYFSSTTTYYYETTPRGLTVGPQTGSGRMDSHDLGGATILRF
jgi:tetratricopeptide (TPR) repeat protein